MIQSKIAIGQGNDRKRFSEGTQTKYGYVPEQSTDFISLRLERNGVSGLFGCDRAVYLLLLRVINLAERQRSTFPGFMDRGQYYLLPRFINIGMTIGIILVIGIPLPFISYGGSSL
ncbi:hypothetical protein CS542_04500 [Pedobacter sp. IW39]|nr:hypothetical protein CS542_04500 [Pedobacter sp. IW39]